MEDHVVKKKVWGCLWLHQKQTHEKKHTEKRESASSFSHREKEGVLEVTCSGEMKPKAYTYITLWSPL